MATSNSMAPPQCLWSSKCYAANALSHRATACRMMPHLLNWCGSWMSARPMIIDVGLAAFFVGHMPRRLPGQTSLICGVELCRLVCIPVCLSSASQSAGQYVRAPLAVLVAPWLCIAWHTMTRILYICTRIVLQISFFANHMAVCTAYVVCRCLKGFESREFPRASTVQHIWCSFGKLLVNLKT